MYALEKILVKSFSYPRIRKLDGASNPEYINQTISVAAHFRQYTQQDVDDESDSERKAELEAFLQANGSVLEYKSIADVEFYISTRTTWAAVATQKFNNRRMDNEND